MPRVKHTPAPWLIEGNEILTNKWKMICKLPDDFDRSKDEEIKVNAYLISAAPELLEACKESLKGYEILKEYMEKVGVDGLFTKKCVFMLNQAIKKAEGT
jgi:hypothetical protein